jgi:hypothetical protein
MPEANLSGEVFTADASAGFDEGIVRGDVGSGARLSFATRFELCHGLSAEASAEAAAQAVADLGLLWLIAGRAEGEALAAAGVRLDAQATIDLFDRVGLSADLAAFAEASLAGRLSVGLDAAEIARAADQMLSGPALEVFLALLREARIEAGVWAKISVAAMAKARLNVRGSLADDDHAGFVVEMGAEAGLAAGGGYDFYAGILLDSPKRFFLNAADIITGAILDEARPLVPPALRPHLAALEYVLPASLATAYELAQVPTAEMAARPEQAGEILADCFTAELQRFALDKLGLAGAIVIGRALDEAATRVAELSLTPAQRQAGADATQVLIEALEGRPLTFTTISPAVPALAEVLGLAAPDTRAQWRPVLSATWLALAAAESIRQGIVPLQAQAEAGIIGLRRAAAEAFLVELPETPAIVREELEPLIGQVPDRLELGTVVDYLVTSRLLPLLEELVPDLYALMELIARETGVSAPDFVELALRAAAGDDLTETRLYEAMRAVAGSALDELLLEGLLPALDDALPDDANSRVWVDEVARPGLTMMRDFTLRRVDDLVAGRGVDEDTLRAGLSLMIGKIVLNNVVVLTDILLDHVTASVSESTRELSDALRNDPGHPLAQPADELAQILLATLGLRLHPVADASRELAAELLLAVSEATSDEILTDERRAAVRALVRRIVFTAYGEPDLSSPDTMEDTLAEIAACAYVPAPDAVAELVVVQTETLAEQVAVALPRVEQAVELFIRRTGDALIDQVERGAAELLRQGRDQLVRLARRLLVLSRAAQHWLEEASKWAADKQAQLDAAARALCSSARRKEILDALELEGIRAAEAAARSAPGFDLLPREAQEGAVVVATGGFVLSFGLARPLLDAGLQVLGEIADELADLFGAAADLLGLIATLADEINDRVEEAIEDLAGLDLPDELSVTDVARVAVEVVTELPVIRDALGAAFDARREESAAHGKRTAAEDQHQQAVQDKRRAELDRSRAIGKRPAEITICSPQPLADALDEVWAYGDRVPVQITIRNLPEVPRTALGLTPGPVVLLLNGSRLRIAASAWRHEPGRYRLTHTLDRRSSPLRPGANVLECAYADSVHEPVRASVLFLVHASALSDEAAAEPDGDTLAVRAGRLPVDLRGWRMYDGGGRTPLKGSLKPGERLSLTDLTFVPGIGNGPRPPRDCAPRLTLVDELRRWRGEVIPRRPR